MPTLAKDLLESEEFIPEDQPYLAQLMRWTYSFLKKRLTAPLPDARGIEDLVAERFVFDCDAPNYVQELINAGALNRQVLDETVRFPDAPVWIEYPMMYGEDAPNNPPTPGKLGVLIDRITIGDNAISETAYGICVVGQCDTPAVPIALTMVNEFPVRGDTRMMPLFYLDQCGKIDDEYMASMLNYINEITACLFLLQTPRVVELTRSSFGNPKKKHQTKEKPFVELHRVKMRIGVPEKRYEGKPGTAPSEPHSGVRKYHRVMPHFRMYGKGTDKPRARLIDTFWRGNPEKGIVLHERVVEIKK